VLSLPGAPEPNAPGFAFPRASQQGEPTVTRPITKEQLSIDWSWNAQRIVNHVRAFSPQPAARALLDGETVKLLHAHIGEEGPLKIQTGDGTFVTVDELIAPNRGRETGAAYVARRG
jgi:methionyl-tRNA formyltransferase